MVRLVAEYDGETLFGVNCEPDSSLRYDPSARPLSAREGVALYVWRECIESQEKAAASHARGDQWSSALYSRIARSEYETVRLTLAGMTADERARTGL